MIDLVLIRELIRNDTARGHEGDVNRIFAQTGLGCLFESILARSSLPYKPVAIALTFSSMGVTTINSCSRAGTTVREFPERYAIRLDRHLHIGLLLTIVGLMLK